MNAQRRRQNRRYSGSSNDDQTNRDHVKIDEAELEFEQRRHSCLPGDVGDGASKRRAPRRHSDAFIFDAGILSTGEEGLNSNGLYAEKLGKIEDEKMQKMHPQDKDESGRVQYHIKHEKKLNTPDRLIRRGVIVMDYIFCGCYNGTGILTEYLYWSFRTSFFMLFCTTLIFFMFLIFLFAISMMIAGVNHPECFEPNFNRTDTSVFVNEMFMLSWTTLSTVGYGSIYPSLGSQLEENNEICSLLSFLCAVEAFVGVLYGGFVGAVIFGKVLRVQSRAQVIFSDPLVIRYGCGLHDVDCEEGCIPCPILEFRCINKFHDKIGGEVFDATLNCVAIVNPPIGNLSPACHNTIDLHATTIFAKMQIGTEQNPFFKRTWLAQHRLNAESPLLKQAVKNLIARNNGYWPTSLNNAESVRNSINFRHISVTFSGVCNYSASSVYDNKLYDFSDVNIGYQFVTILYLSEDNDIQVNVDLVNDVWEQDGGGGETKVKCSLEKE